MCSARSVMTVWRECINQRKDQIVSTMHFELISSHNLPAKQSWAFIIYLIEETKKKSWFFISLTQFESNFSMWGKADDFSYCFINTFCISTRKTILHSFGTNGVTNFHSFRKFSKWTYLQLFNTNNVWPLTG